MRECTLSVRSLSCKAVVHFRVLGKYNLDPEALEDRLISMVDFEFELERIVGSQGNVFYELRLPHDRLFDSRRQGLLGALAQIERDIEEALLRRELMRMVEGEL